MFLNVIVIIIVVECIKRTLERIIKHLFLIFTFFIINLNADSISDLAKELNLYPGTKATVQWERVFSSERRLEKYKLNQLSQTTKDSLKAYLIHHAADSEQPIVPGL